MWRSASEAIPSRVEAPTPSDRPTRTLHQTLHAPPAACCEAQPLTESLAKVPPDQPLEFLSIPLDGIRVQTNLTRCLGPVSEWPTQLAEPIAAGFNMIHLTPPQKLGASGSAYSVFDQLELEPSLFEHPETHAPFHRLQAELLRLEREHGVLAMADLVLNHTAANSAFLATHPDAGFSIDNSPWLRPAAVLDAVVRTASREIIQTAPAKAYRMASARDIGAAVNAVKHGFDRARLWEFYIAAPEPNMAALAVWAAGSRWRMTNHLGMDMAPRDKPTRTPMEEIVNEALGTPGQGHQDCAGIQVATLGPTDPWTAPKAHLALARLQGAAKQAKLDVSITDKEVREATNDMLDPHALTPDVNGPLEASSPIVGPTIWNAGTGRRFPIRIQPCAVAKAIATTFRRRIQWDLVGAVARGEMSDAHHEWPRACSECHVALLCCKRLAEGANVGLYERYNSDIESALRAITGAAENMWLTELGAHASMTDADERPLVWNYFVQAGDSVLACNGFIWGGDPKIDFTIPKDIAKQYSDFAAAETSRPQFAPGGPSQLESSPLIDSTSLDEELESCPFGPPLRRIPSSSAWGLLPQTIDVCLVLASTPYMRREVVIWGDCVKLRYGLERDDSPYLWDRMEEYSRQTARLFHAIRLDNAHGTPPWVAQHMLDAARQERPSLYVNAELFTTSNEDDVLYVSMLGINSIVREAIQTSSERDLASYIHPSHVGGTAFASLRHAETVAPAPGYPARFAVQECLPCPIPTLLFDCTHDNATLSQKRTPQDSLSTMAIVCAAACAGGSVRGFDRLVARNPSVVTDFRRYEEGGEDVSGRGLTPARSALNELSITMAERGYSEVHVHYEESGGSKLIVVTRGHPSRPGAYVFVCRPAFSRGCLSAAVRSLPRIRVEGIVRRVEFAARVRVDMEASDRAARQALELLPGKESASAAFSSFCGARKRGDAAAVDRFRHQAFVTGVPCELESVFRPTGHADASDPGLASLGMVRWTVDSPGPSSEAAHPGSCSWMDLDPVHFPPGSVLVVKVRAPRNFQVPLSPSLQGPLGEGASPLAGALPAAFGPSLRELDDALGLRGDISQLYRGGSSSLTASPPSLCDLCVLLFRSDAEERDDTKGAGGVYSVPGHGALAWAGVAGLESVLRDIRRWNNLGHPVCENIRQGNWLLDYVVGRLRRRPALKRVQAWVGAHAEIVKQMPPGMRPQGVDRIVSALYHSGVAAVIQHLQLGGSPVLNRVLPALRGDGSTRAGQLPKHLRRTGSTLDAVVSFTDDEDMADIADSALGFDGSADVTSPKPPASRARARRQSQVADPMALQVHSAPSSAPPLVVSLALTSVQLFSQTESAPLLEPALLVLDPQRDADEENAAAGRELCSAKGSLAAGVEHFCTGFMRNWGRDTFISLRGLLLLTGRFAEARRVILAYASVVRHGLIPNLMDGGRNPRYNARDATWWWLQAVVDFVRITPPARGGGLVREDGRCHLLDEMVVPRFPSDSAEDYDPPATGRFVGDASLACPRPLGAVIADVLRRHAGGIHFREWRAGHEIDAHMQTDGFDVSVRLDHDTGLLMGGNRWNCGTWMDKMGESARHGTKGVPATPRDGAPVEISGLLYSVLRWAGEMSRVGLLPAEGVDLAKGGRWSWDDWADTIEREFERCYWVPLEDEGLDLAPDGPRPADCRVNARLVNGRGVYKDTYGASNEWADYQLRPNLLVSMAVAPELFSPGRAALALSAVERQLLGDEPGQMGVKTLDPSDWAYRGDYSNGDSADRATAQGWNYHQGPEWLWPFGYYLRARLLFPPYLALGELLPEPRGRSAEADSGIRRSSSSVRTRRSGPSDDTPSDDVPMTPSVPAGRWSGAAARRWVLTQVHRHRAHLEQSAHGGLPELTNAGGRVCPDSCVVQAWSAATLLDALWDAYESADS
jgi:glycogen debranching enzyme